MKIFKTPFETLQNSAIRCRVPNTYLVEKNPYLTENISMLEDGGTYLASANINIFMIAKALAQGVGVQIVNLSEVPSIIAAIGSYLDEIRYSEIVNKIDRSSDAGISLNELVKLKHFLEKQLVKRRYGRNLDLKSISDIISEVGKEVDG